MSAIEELFNQIIMRGWEWIGVYHGIGYQQG